MTRTRAALLALLGSFSQATYGQAIIQADMAAIQPQTYREGAQINGCGQRVILMSIASEKEAYVADFSVSVRVEAAKRDFYAMTKAGIYRQDPRRDIESRRVAPISSFFISSPDGAVAISPAKFIKAETPSFLLGVGRDDTGPATELMLKMRSGDRTQFGIRLKDESVTRVYSFVPTIEAADAEAFDACMRGLMAQIQRLREALETDAARDAP